ncbi:hypothetical protein CF124_21730 [Aeromonas hydrophila]|nr:hypothetical protein A9R12_10190 [Aeromonas hydrophila]TNI62388.1 hypothetical protein CF124_21730 [Aeromonas hydrophila]
MLLHHGNQPAVARRVYQHFLQCRNHLQQDGFGLLTVCRYLGTQLHQSFNQVAIGKATNNSYRLLDFFHIPQCPDNGSSTDFDGIPKAWNDANQAQRALCEMHIIIELHRLLVGDITPLTDGIEVDDLTDHRYKPE